MFSIMGLPVLGQLRIIVSPSIILRNYIFANPEFKNGNRKCVMIGMRDAAPFGWSKQSVESFAYLNLNTKRVRCNGVADFDAQ